VCGPHLCRMPATFCHGPSPSPGRSNRPQHDPNIYACPISCRLTASSRSEMEFSPGQAF
jgi:hypothetical protein